MATNPTSEDKTLNQSYSQAAKDACSLYPESDIEAAIQFCGKFDKLKPFIACSNDRLVKAGRSMRSLLDLLDEDALELSLELLAQECEVLADDSIDLRVPKVRFGKTELLMPIATLGCMRFQQEWGPRITNMNMVGSNCQDNLVQILKQAIQKHGMVHIETARGYGSSELQLGCALKQLFLTTDIKREDVIIQVKVPAKESVIEFRETIGTSFQNLQIDYCDLFSLHGFNYEEQFEWVFGKEKMKVVPKAEPKIEEKNDSQTKEGEKEDQGKNEEDDGEATKREGGEEEDPQEDLHETCMSVLEEFVEAGKIRHLGFSTHGPTELICRAIATDKFEYANIHYHYFGSYTASGGPDGAGNNLAIKMLAERDMGCFIISPFDKGGALYKPSKKLRALTLPDMEPLYFGLNWIWNHHKLEEGNAHLHTFTLGAARAADLDNAAVAAYLFKTKPDEVLAKTKAIRDRLEAAKIQALGEEFADHWWKGLPKAYQCKSLVEHNQIVWLYTIIKSFGMLEFAKDRYKSFESNLSKWDPNKSSEENIEKNIGKNSWGFVPGLPLVPDRDYSDELVSVPYENKMRVKKAQECVIKWVATESLKSDRRKTWQERMDDVRRASSRVLGVTNSDKKQLEELAEMDEEGGSKNFERHDDDEDNIPSNWSTSYDMRPWLDFPDQPKPSS